MLEQGEQVTFQTPEQTRNKTLFFFSIRILYKYRFCPSANTKAKYALFPPFDFEETNLKVLISIIVCITLNPRPVAPSEFQNDVLPLHA